MMKMHAIYKGNSSNVNANNQLSSIKGDEENWNSSHFQYSSSCSPTYHQYKNNFASECSIEKNKNHFSTQSSPSQTVSSQSQKLEPAPAPVYIIGKDNNWFLVQPPPTAVPKFTQTQNDVGPSYIIKKDELEYLLQFSPKGEPLLTQIHDNFNLNRGSVPVKENLPFKFRHPSEPVSTNPSLSQKLELQNKSVAKSFKSIAKRKKPYSLKKVPKNMHDDLSGVGSSDYSSSAVTSPPMHSANSLHFLHTLNKPNTEYEHMGALSNKVEELKKMKHVYGSASQREKLKNLEKKDHLNNAFSHSSSLRHLNSSSSAHSSSSSHLYSSSAVHSHLSSSAFKIKRDYSRVHKHHSEGKSEALLQRTFLEVLEKKVKSNSNHSNHLNSTSHTDREENIPSNTAVKPSNTIDDTSQQPPTQVNKCVKKINLQEYYEKKRKEYPEKKEVFFKSSLENESKQRLSNRNKGKLDENIISQILGDSVDSFYKKERGDAESQIDSRDKVVKSFVVGANDWSPDSTKNTEQNISIERDTNNPLVQKEAFYAKTVENSSLPEDTSIDEMDILTISSDEEEKDGFDEETMNSDSHKTSKASMLSGGGPEEQDKCCTSEISYDEELFAEMSEDFVALNCKFLCFGSYKVNPKSKIKLTQGCFTVFVPTLNKEEKPIKLVMKQRGIVGVRVQLDGDDPMIILYSKPSMAGYIRSILHMTQHGPYLDPYSKDECERRIAIFPEPIQEEFKLSIREFWTNLVDERSRREVDLIKDISTQEASEIVFTLKPVTENKNSDPIADQNTETFRLFVYPPPPVKGGITITTDDYICLEEGKYLNDVILDFYIKWLMLNRLSDKDLERTHVFSTFFYKGLTSKPKNARRPRPSEKEMTPAEERHARVQSWTKHVDIFSKDFIIIPINAKSHWYLAVICFPGLDGPVSTKDGKPVILKNEKVGQSSLVPKSRIKIPTLDDLDWSDRDEAEGDEEELEYDDLEPPSKKLRTKNAEENHTSSNASLSPSTDEANDAEENPIKQPCILIFDSMATSSKNRIVATLREYLEEEYKAKKNQERRFTKDTMKAACPEVAQQTNYSDCGLFTLQFVQSFFEYPLRDFRFPIRNLSDWFNTDIVACKRSYIAGLIRQLLDDQKPNHRIVLPKLYFSSDEKKKQHSTKSLSDELDTKSSIEKPNSISALEAAKNNDNTILEKVYKLQSEFKLNKNKQLLLQLLDSPPQLNSLPSDGQEKSASGIKQKEAKRVKVTLCDKSNSIARPRTPLPYNNVPSPPLVISEDDSGHHSDIEDLNKGFYEESSRESFSSSFSNKDSSSKTSAKEKFSVSSKSAFRKSQNLVPIKSSKIERKDESSFLCNFSELEKKENSHHLSQSSFRPYKSDVKNSFHSMSSYSINDEHKESNVHSNPDFER